MRFLPVLGAASGALAVCILAVLGGCGGSDNTSVSTPDDSGSSQEAATDAGSDSTASDAEASIDAGDASDTSPIAAPDDQWTWVDFPTSKCGSGTPTGIAVNPHAGATETMIFMQGGGSCMTGDTCWGASPGAVNMAGFGATDFTAQLPAYPLLNRSIATNPVNAMNFVFVPYCTGDLHDGTAEVDLMVSGATKPTYFYGGLDMDIFLARIVPTFPGMTRVVLAGTSAGGFGTFLSFDKTARAFGGLRVDVIDDSGPPIPNASGVSASGGGVWNLEKPVACPSCVSLRDIYDADRLQQPNSRFGLLTFDRDSTIAPDFGYTVDQYPAVISTFTSTIASDKNAAVLEITLTPPDAEHVVESKPVTAPTYFPWMTKLLSDDATWANETVPE